MLGTTLSFKPAGRFKFSKTDISVLFILLCYVIGFSVSVFLIIGDNSVILNSLNGYFDKLITIKSQCSFIVQALYSFALFSAYILLTYFFGTSILGVAVIPTISVLKGVVDGMTVCYVYRTFALNGIGFSILILAPYIILSSYLLTLACRESVCFSMLVLNNSVPRGTSYNLSANFKVFNIRYLFILLLGVIISIVSATFSVLFFDYFNF